MKKISVVRLFSTGKRKVIVPPYNNIRIVKGELLYYLENLDTFTIEKDKDIELKLVIDGTEWNLPAFSEKEVMMYQLDDLMDKIYRGMEHVIDLNEAFYED